MIVCPKCGKELADGTKFCSKCGTPLADVKPVEAPKKEEAPAAAAPKKEEAPKAETPKKEEAPKAEAPKKEEAPKAEAPKAEAPKAEAPKAEAPKKEEAPKAEEGEKKGLNSNIIKFAGIGVAAIVFLIILIALFSGGKKGTKPYALYVKDKELMYTTNLSKAKKAVQVSTKLIKESGISNADMDGIGDALDAQISEDGKYLFYRDKIESSDDGSTIYYKDLTKLKKESQKMDSSVKSYQINKNASVVTYLKTSGDLWQFNVKKGEKAEKKVGKNVRTYYVNDDATKIIYTTKNEDDNSTEIHVWTKKSDEKLESDIQSLYYVTDDFKTIYYKKNDSLYKKVGNKDKEKVDSDVSNVYRVYENGSIYYLKKDDGVGTLYFYNGKESKKIEEDIKGSIDYFTNSETPMMIYGVEEGSKAKYSIVIKDVVKELDQEDISRAVFDEKGKTVYFIAELNSESSRGTLFKMTISGTKVGKVEQYDDDVANTSMTLTDDNHVIYFKDVKNRKGEMFCDKKQLDSDVYTSYKTYNKDTKEIVYYVDYNTNKDEGTLKITKTNGKARQISDEVYDYVVLPNGSVIYLKEYSQKSGEGSLYAFKGKKSVLLDDEVSVIVHAY